MLIKSLRYRQTPAYTNKHETAHAVRREPTATYSRVFLDGGNFSVVENKSVKPNYLLCYVTIFSSFVFVFLCLLIGANIYIITEKWTFNRQKNIILPKKFLKTETFYKFVQ